MGQRLENSQKTFNERMRETESNLVESCSKFQEHVRGRLKKLEDALPGAALSSPAHSPRSEVQSATAHSPRSEVHSSPAPQLQGPRSLFQMLEETLEQKG